ncbi:hypothetical protein CHLNCDRAFT_139625 [Chlorella variabilis]|uniref:CBM20 domain-containing protein n=1 Tax=Chlorella variabilis TaxID=554065 RepID=E1ZQK1_CHLVA|nr:hypothetical protein CHLNCDRAFT_139625 [Chlorella variabilis]EFN51954.1 hypothetical protein CHLNCDRAFT_139625 [Chlorella variabilis]|eukprot:XP_005844056.1 hypothetical protein CHLNCDRAFT_139625 [Chlorella variabilis]
MCLCRGNKAVEVPAGSVAVSFILKKETYYGQRVLLVGSSQELGAWKLDAGLPLRWSEEHKWSTTVALPAGAAVEYKFVITDPEQPPLWESCLNRSLAVEDAAATLYGSREEPLVAAAVPPPRPVEVPAQPVTIAAPELKQPVAASIASAAPVAKAAAAAKPAAAAAKAGAAPKQQAAKEIKISAEAEAAVNDIIVQADGGTGMVAGAVEKLGAAAASVAGGIIKQGKAAAKGGRRRRPKANATKKE